MNVDTTCVLVLIEVRIVQSPRIDHHYKGNATCYL